MRAAPCAKPCTVVGGALLFALVSECFECCGEPTQLNTLQSMHRITYIPYSINAIIRIEKYLDFDAAAAEQLSRVRQLAPLQARTHAHAACCGSVQSGTSSWSALRPKPGRKLPQQFYYHFGAIRRQMRRDRDRVDYLDYASAYVIVVHRRIATHIAQRRAAKQQLHTKQHTT